MMTLEGTRHILWDAGNAYLATIRPDTIDAVYVHQWGPDTRIRHHIVIGRLDGKLSFDVDEVSAEGVVRNEMARESGNCSPERNHPGQLQDKNSRQLRK